MVTYSIIQKSQLEGATRLDAEYYQPLYLQIAQQIRQQKADVRKLKDLIVSPVITGTTPKQRACKGDSSDIKFIKTDVLRDGEIDFDSADCLPEVQNRKSSQPKAGDVLTTIIGADYPIVGRSALIFPENPTMNINQNVVRIRPKDSLLPEYLISFIRSKFGIMQLWQQSRQTEQVNLNCREVENILIPVYPLVIQKLFIQLVINAKTEKDLSISYYQQAEKLLLEELGLADFKPREDLSFVTNLSEVADASRVDADFFQPKYEELIAKLKEQNVRTLTEVVQNVDARFNPINFSDKEFQYVELANINSSIGVIDGSDDVLGKEAPSRAKRVLKSGDVIVSTVEGSLEKVALVSEDQNDYLASTGFFQFRSKEILPEALLILAKSIVLQIQLKRHCAGTILTAVPSEALQKTVLPILPKETQEKITDLVRKSHEARK